MQTADKVFSDSIAAIYEDLMVPTYFLPYAEALAGQVAALGPKRVLEIAAGTGAVTRLLAAKSPGINITATDLNQAMLDVAAARLNGAAVAFQQADALALLFTGHTFDVAMCQFGAMFFPDKAKAFREAARVLAHRGTFIFSVWDSLEHNEVTGIVGQAVAGRFAADPPDFFARVPFGYHDIGAIAASVKEAGFTTVDALTLQKPCLVPSAKTAAYALCQGTPLRSQIEARDPAGLTVATDAAAAALEAKFGAGPIVSTMQAIVFTARK